MAYNGQANIGRLAWKMDVYGSRTSPQSRRHRRMRRMGKESYLIRQAVARVEPRLLACRVGRHALADFLQFRHLGAQSCCKPSRRWRAVLGHGDGEFPQDLSRKKSNETVTSPNPM
jgi:hypothetical protein